MGSRYFWRLYASFAALVLLTTTTTGLLVDARVEKTLRSSFELSLHKACELVRPLADRILDGDQSPKAHAELKRASSATGIRITLIRASGVVIADTHRDVAGMENHRTRPEIQRAISSSDGLGLDRRSSASIDEEMLYVAHRVELSNGENAVVRVALKMTELQANLADVRARIRLGAAIGAGVALLLGFYFARRMTAPLAEMIRVTDDFARGNYDSRARRLPADELGQLGAALNHLGRSVGDNLLKISKDDARLRAMLTGVVEAVIAVDDQDCVVFCNKAGGRLLGTDRQEAKGRPLVQLERIAEIDSLLADARERGRAASRELVVSRAGREIIYQAHATPFQAAAERGVVAVLHDITELRRLEQVRSDFMTNVSHELKTPLTSIQGYVETLLDGALHDPENNTRFLKKVRTHVMRLTHLVGDLLSLARIEAQSQSPPKVPVEWADLIESAVNRHEASARSAKVTCEVERGQALALGDPEAMTQVLDNLISNAIRYTQPGGRLVIRTNVQSPWAVLEVEDTGIGIPEVDLDRIFERFYRVDKARSRDLGGTGLGLSIVKHLVLAMGGEITVRSREGEGTLFRVQLPCADSPDRGSGGDSH